MKKALSAVGMLDYAENASHALSGGQKQRIAIAGMLAMQPEGSEKRLDFSVKKDGTISGAVATREDFKDLEQYVMMLLSQMVDDIASGNITANPYTRGNSHNACSYCPYGQICHSELVEGRRDYAAMKTEEFWDRIRKKVAANG